MRACVLFLVGCGTSSPIVEDSGVTIDAGAMPDVVMQEASSLNDAAMDAGPPDPCPALKIPQTINQRSVVYREWSPSATGDGTYFATQAPWRLGFNRTQNTIWIVKFRTEANTYLGKVSAYGDSTGGIAWISDDPNNPKFAIDGKLVVYGNHGGGTIDFTVARNASDAMTLKSDPKWSWMPQLQGDHCYYAMFENVDSWPMSAIDSNFITMSGDDCGANSNGVCYYLAFDMGHLLHDPVSMQTFAGNVIAGLTQ